MAAFKFIGTGDEFTFLGRTFGRNDVIALDPAVEAEYIEILKGNPFFELTEVDGEANATAYLAELRLQADELGIEYDGRTGAKKLQAAINEALNK